MMNRGALFVLVLLVPAAGTQAQPKPGGPRPRNSDRLDVMKQAAGRYRFRAGAGEGAAHLVAEPLLRWSNPVAQEEDAGLFLWTRQGRPEAAAQFFVRKDVWMHEFQSLSEGTFAVDWDGRTVWSPRKSGVAFRPSPASEAPDSSPVRRLRQMRAVAESFTASVEFQYSGDSHYELRLLTRPLHRYGQAGETASDGTLWAFVQGTNPEVLLLVESRRAPDSTSRWHYAFAAMTSYPAEAKHGGKSVWKVDRQPIPTPTTQGPYLFRYDVPTETPESGGSRSRVGDPGT
jgi:hypothetical protein